MWIVVLKYFSEYRIHVFYVLVKIPNNFINCFDTIYKNMLHVETTVTVLRVQNWKE